MTCHFSHLSILSMLQSAFFCYSVTWVLTEGISLFYDLLHTLSNSV